MKASVIGANGILSVAFAKYFCAKEDLSVDV